jgi:hypothetical protein
LGPGGGGETYQLKFQLEFGGFTSDIATYKLCIEIVGERYLGVGSEKEERQNSTDHQTEKE